MLCAVVMMVSARLPWLVIDQSNRSNALGGKLGVIAFPPSGFGVGQLIVLLTSGLVVAAAMAARSLSPRISSTAALALSVLVTVLAVWYYRLYVASPISAGFGFYIAVVAGVVAAVLSVLTMIVAWAGSAR